MARNNRGGRDSNLGGRTNNPEGRNQYSGGIMDLARERPLTAAMTAVGAAATGLFLWSRRSQITDQLSNLSDQMSEWTESMRSGDGNGSYGSDDTGGLTTSQRGMSETGGGNASLGRSSGGSGSRGTASGRGRAESTATTQQ